MNINLNLTNSVLEFLLNANDPEREVWKNIDDLTPEDVRGMIQDILSSWIETH